jgi:hypothetical protein
MADEHGVEQVDLMAQDCTWSSTTAATMTRKPDGNWALQGVSCLAQPGDVPHS